MKTIDQAYLRSQHLDSKTLSTLSNISILKILSALLGIFILLSGLQFSFAEVFVPIDEYVGYFDSNGVYTVVGNVKNEFDFAIVPTISISVNDNSEIFSKTFKHVPLSSGAEIPFKIKFTEILGDSPVLLPIKLSYEKIKQDEIPIVVLL